jgi:hypothetical protein
VPDVEGPGREGRVPQPCAPDGARPLWTQTGSVPGEAATGCRPVCSNTVITVILQLSEGEAAGAGRPVLAVHSLTCMGPVSAQVTGAQKGRLLVFTHSSGLCTASQRAVHGYRSHLDAAIMPR